MELEKIKDLLKNGKRVVARIKDTSQIIPEHFFSDKNMMGNLVSIDVDEDGYYVLKFELNEFKEHNKALMGSEWFNDKTGNYDLNYQEYHGEIAVKEEHSYSKEELNSGIFEFIIDESFLFLFDEYVHYCSSSDDKPSYLSWLENEVIKCREKK